MSMNLIIIILLMVFNIIMLILNLVYRSKLIETRYIIDGISLKGNQRDKKISELKEYLEENKNITTQNNVSIIELKNAFLNHKKSNKETFKIIVKHQNNYIRELKQSIKKQDKTIEELKSNFMHFEQILVSYDKNTQSRIDILFNKLKRNNMIK